MGDPWAGLAAWDGKLVRLAGWLARAGAGGGWLLAEPPCCPGCLPAAAGRVWVPGAGGNGPAEMEGELHRAGAGWALRGARRAGFGRRRVLAAAPLLCLAAAAPVGVPPAGAVTVDVHSHAGRLLAVRSAAPFTPLAAPMRAGGLAVACLAIVSDAPTHRVMADHRIHPYREPAPGELYAYAQLGFARLHALAAQEGMPILTDAASLAAARPERPGVVVCAEGADFLEGDPDRIDEAYARWQLRHLQLVHYRVNELGDIQTEDPVHGGLTDMGAAAVERCNRRGLVVDVAHGTLELVRRAARVTRRPLVLSHTSLTARPRPYTRLITREHARLVADTDGVIGIWPVKALFPDYAALAGAMARMAAAVGVDHVALGTDQLGLVGPSTLPSYADLPGLVAALAEAGFGAGDTAKLMGGNYARVFAASMAPG